MSVWEVLEIDPTEDVSAIKKAYAKKLKLHHPEDDPEGYQRLREAYDGAMKQAKRLAGEYRNSEAVVSAPYREQEELRPYAQQYSNDPDSADGMDVPYEQYELYRNPVHETTLTEQPPVHPIQGFMARLDALYSDFYARIDTSNWETLLNSDIVWNVEHSEALQDALISFLEDCHHLPRPVWELMDMMFHWTENRNELMERHPEYFVKYMLHEISGSMEMGYDCFRNSGLPEGFDFEAYLELRQDARDMLMNRELEEAAEYLEEAHEMFAADPDLELMRGKYFAETGETRAALQCFETVLSLRSDDGDARWLLARILHDREEYGEALRHYEFILDREPENLDALWMAGSCRLGLGQAEAARECLKKGNELDRMHVRTIIGLMKSRNKDLYVQEPVPKDQKIKLFLGQLYFSLFLFLRLSWLFLFLCLGMFLFFGLDPVYKALFSGIFLLNAWKTWRIMYKLG
ncbi:tetratricopeptide repeat protein [Paenibacillus sp. DMB20]|uniref:tetratricopeptide repeat protein n=1 Tax=Paenibacillus sp. DMB20 TaxID=1642570 RepID=UPI00069970F1|nr:tetratricopeptide repeat protein [Paenibacillus sp. DMB20]